MAAIRPHPVHWLGKALGLTAALVFAPAHPALLVWWLAAGLAAGQLLDSVAGRLDGHRRGPRSDAAASSPANRVPDDLARAWETLDVSADDDVAAIRLAYRRAVARWHPDRLPQNAGDTERRAAQARMCELRDALDVALAAKAAGDLKAGG